MGDGGANDGQDTRYIQSLLNDWRGRHGRSLIGIDGLVGGETIGAITDFQRTVTGVADGRIDVGFQAITALERSHVDAAQAAMRLGELHQLGTQDLARAVYRPDPDALLLEVIETDAITAVGTGMQQYVDHLHAET